MAGRVLVIDDDAAIRRVLLRFLDSVGLQGIEAGDCEAGLRAVRNHYDELDLVIVDYQLPDGTGLELLPKLLAVDRGLPIVMLTGFGSVALATRAAHLGAVDFLEKPVDLPTLAPVIERARRRRQIDRRLESIAGRYGDAFAPIVTQSAEMDAALSMAARVAPTDAAVLLIGESGTGKELFARALHAASPRSGGPFVALNCAAIPADLLESELFGHRKGAFTGANEDRVGRFEQARGGTLFLDEIGDMAPALQAKVLRVLQEKTVTPLGGDRERPVDVRIVAATHRDLRAMAETGEFREDLWFRLAEFPLEIPPLRERAGDVPLLTQRVLADAVAAGIVYGGMAPVVMEVLQSWNWPGNVRELQNVVRRAAILAAGDVIEVRHLPSDLLAAAKIPLAPPAASTPTQKAGGEDGLALVPEWRTADDVWTLERLEATAIRRAHEICGDNLTDLAQRLGIGRTTLYRKLEALGLSAASTKDE